MLGVAVEFYAFSTVVQACRYLQNLKVLTREFMQYAKLLEKLDRELYHVVNVLFIATIVFIYGIQAIR